MKVVIDNNVVIDALYPNPEFEAGALQVLRLASTGAIRGYVCANSLTDIFYVVRKTRGDEYTKEKLKGLMAFTEIISVGEADCAAALESPMSDFEDALVEVCAAKAGADFIVSRDEAFIKAAAEVRVITPGEMLEKLRQSSGV